MLQPNELAQALAGDSAHTPPALLLEGVAEAVAHTVVPGAPHTIYQELWHICFWLNITLDWCAGRLTPFPVNARAPFAADTGEPFEVLAARFDTNIRKATALTTQPFRLDALIACPSRPGHPTRTMTVREQLESLAAHNSYHFGRIVLLRQILGVWPPPRGGYTW